MDDYLSIVLGLKKLALISNLLTKMPLSPQQSVVQTLVSFNVSASSSNQAETGVFPVAQSRLISEWS